MASCVDDAQWLNTNPRLEELIERFPHLLEEALRELTTAAATGHVEEVNAVVARAKSNAEIWNKRVAKSRNNPKVVEAAVQHVARSKMLLLALDRCHLAAGAGKISGKARFTIVNGLILQQLLFRRNLARKPASLRLFKLCWPLITQKRLLMPLVQRKGIYCFYSKELLARLEESISGGECLEIGAGDGTLSRFLSERGISARATDDQSWGHTIEYPPEVEKLDAKTALHTYQPHTVLCSWPPPGNSFERHVFLTDSVQTYIVIGSRYPYLSGNWNAYAEQTGFDWGIDETMSKLVIPPGLHNAVVVFRRKAL